MASSPARSARPRRPREAPLPPPRTRRITLSRSTPHPPSHAQFEIGDDGNEPRETEAPTQQAGIGELLAGSGISDAPPVNAPLAKKRTQEVRRLFPRSAGRPYHPDPRISDTLASASPCAGREDHRIGRAQASDVWDTGCTVGMRPVAGVRQRPPGLLLACPASADLTRLHSFAPPSCPAASIFSLPHF